MTKFSYTNAQENLTHILDMAIAGETVEIVHLDGTSVMVVSKEKYEACRKALLSAEFKELMSEFEISNKALIII